MVGCARLGAAGNQVFSSASYPRKPPPNPLHSLPQHMLHCNVKKASNSLVPMNINDVTAAEIQARFSEASGAVPRAEHVIGKPPPPDPTNAGIPPGMMAQLQSMLGVGGTVTARVEPAESLFPKFV